MVSKCQRSCCALIVYHIVIQTISLERNFQKASSVAYNSTTNAMHTTNVMGNSSTQFNWF